MDRVGGHHLWQRAEAIDLVAAADAGQSVAAIEHFLPRRLHELVVVLFFEMIGGQGPDVEFFALEVSEFQGQLDIGLGLGLGVCGFESWQQGGAVGDLAFEFVIEQQHEHGSRSDHVAGLVSHFADDRVDRSHDGVSFGTQVTDESARGGPVVEPTGESQSAEQGQHQQQQGAVRWSRQRETVGGSGDRRVVDAGCDRCGRFGHDGRLGRCVSWTRGVVSGFHGCADRCRGVL